MTRHRLVAALLLATAFALPAASASGWSREGHMVVGAMAYARLQQIDPDALASVLAELRQHPHYAQMLRPPTTRDLDAEDLDLAIFMRASRWADDIRAGRFEAWDHPTWHYVNYHYDGAQIRPPGPPQVDGFLLHALEDSRAGLESSSASDRAVALTWLFHLIGDVHQPLHAIEYHAPEHPDGDRGGNLLFVRATDDDETIRLHGIWDSLLTGTARSTDVRDLGHQILGRLSGAEPRFEALALRLDFPLWAGESAELAVHHVYRSGTLRGGTGASGTVLPPEYLESSKALAEERAVIAAFRLAELLADAY